jgi:hypothetical protein
LDPVYYLYRAPLTRNKEGKQTELWQTKLFLDKKIICDRKDIYTSKPLDPSRPLPTVLHSYGMMRLSARLEVAVTILLVNVAVAFTLLALLEKAGNGEDEQNSNADHAEHGGEDLVNEAIGEAGDGGGTAAEKGGGNRTWAGVVEDEGWVLAVFVAAAVKLGNIVLASVLGGKRGRKNIPLFE